MSLKQRWGNLKERMFGGVLNKGGVFVPNDEWAKRMLNDMKDNIAMANVAMAQVKPEPVCPITKALVVQQLSDLCVKHPNVSIRELISVAMQDGITDDYEFARKLEGVSEILAKRKTEETVRISMKRFGRSMIDPAAQALKNNIDSHMLDALVYGQAAMKITRGQSAGCSDPADKSGSSSEK